MSYSGLLATVISGANKIVDDLAKLIAFVGHRGKILGTSSAIVRGY